MFDKLFNIYLFKKEEIKNFQYLNHHEILNQFSYIDFDNLYVNIDTLIGTSKIFDWTEFNPNIQQSVMFDFFRQLKEHNINFIYSGYILKSILYSLLKSFSIKSIPFQTMYNIKTWKENQRNLNINLSYELQKQKINQVDINNFAYIFCEMSYLYDELYDDFEIDILYRTIYHYFQIILSNKDFNYVLDQKKFFVRFECTKKINKFIYINNNIAHDLFSSFIYKYEFKMINSSKEKIEKLKYIQNLIDNTFTFDFKTINNKSKEINFNKDIKEPYKVSSYKLDNYYDYEELKHEDFDESDPFGSSHDSDWSYSLLDSVVENKEKDNIDEKIIDSEEYKSFLYDDK